jgi:hypothetical protein
MPFARGSELFSHLSDSKWIKAKSFKRRLGSSYSKPQSYPYHFRGIPTGMPYVTDCTDV